MNTKHVLKLVVVSTFICTMLSACVTNPNLNNVVSSKAPLPRLNESLFTPVPVITEAEISYLTDQQRENFFAFLNDPKFATTPRHERVATFMGLILDQFRFSDKTLTAQQSLATKSGNCLSLTILTTAYAELAGVDISYQLLDRDPIYSIQNNLLLTSDHLRAVLSSPEALEDGGSFWSRSRIRIDYFQTDGLSYVDNISIDFQLSLFYSNLAVEQLSIGNLDSAYTHAERALHIYKANASALNTLGIVHRKRGDLAKAEEIYEHGARYFDKAQTFIRNYSALLESQSREVDLDKLAITTTISSKKHLWQWVRAGKNAYTNGDYDRAVFYYQRALALEPDLHQLHQFAGTANFAAGNKRLSRKHFAQALSLANETADRKNYKRKLNALTH